MKKTAYLLTITFAICAALLFSCGGGGGGADNAIDDTSFTMGYNANGAESGTAPAAQSGNGKATLAVSANTGNLARSGYLFDGWNTQPDGYGTDYAPGASYTGKKNITLYAKWARLFNYNINQLSPAPALDGAQRAPGNPTATITGLTDRGQTLSDITIPRTIDGYTVAAIGDNAFQGCTNVANMLIPDTVTDIGDNAFNGCSNLSGVTMQGTVPPTLGTDAFAGCVLLAVSVPQSAASAYNSSPTWSTVTILAPGTFSIIYNGNGSDGGIVPARQVGMVGININVYGNNGSLTRAGCTFNGWNDRADGTGHSYAENAPYPGPDNMTLYAQWAHPDYIVTFDDQGADIQHVSPATITVKAPANTIGSLPSTPPQKNGYYFAGWYTRSDGTGDAFVAGSHVISDKTVYAKWSLNPTYTVTFDSQGATTDASPSIKEVIAPSTTVGVLPTPPLKNGYHFDGWFTSQGNAFTASTSVTADMTVFARWSLNPTYTVTFDSQDATTNASPSRKEVVAPKTTVEQLPTSPVKTGYAFGGWYKGQNGTGTQFFADTFVAGNITVYAKWTANVYQITYKDQGDSAFSGSHGNNYPLSHTYGTDTPLVSPKKDGYIFGGWYLDSACTGPALTLIEATSITQNTTLYAKWNHYSYTVTFDSQDATVNANPESKTVLTPNTKVDSLPSSPTKEHYTFGGWYTGTNGSGTQFTIASSSPAGNISR